MRIFNGHVGYGILNIRIVERERVDAMVNARHWIRKERDENMCNEGFIDDMDAAFVVGKFVELSEAPPTIRFRDMHNYCEQVGKKPFELTEEEMAQFQN